MGDLISADGVAESVKVTVDKRYVLAYKSMFEILVIVEDVRSEVTGSVMTAINIWEMAVIPALLNSAECWFQMPQKTLEKLNQLQEMFYRVILKAGKCSPIPGLYWLTWGIRMRNRM